MGSLTPFTADRIANLECARSPDLLYERDLGRCEVMDGLQRLTTILDFYNNKFPLQGLEILRELNQRTYETLPTEAQRQIDRSQISGIVSLEESIKNKDQQLRMKQLVFERINSGGVQLSNQEARKCAYAWKDERPAWMMLSTFFASSLCANEKTSTGCR